MEKRGQSFEKSVPFLHIWYYRIFQKLFVVSFAFSASILSVFEPVFNAFQEALCTRFFLFLPPCVRSSPWTWRRTGSLAFTQYVPPAGPEKTADNSSAVTHTGSAAPAKTVSGSPFQQMLERAGITL
jgi:hypothetical protein